MIMCENCIVLRIYEPIKFILQNSIHVMKFKCFNAKKVLEMTYPGPRVIYTENLFLKWVTTTHVHRTFS